MREEKRERERERREREREKRESTLGPMEMMRLTINWKTGILLSAKHLLKHIYTDRQRYTDTQTHKERKRGREYTHVFGIEECRQLEDWV